jgi:serine/threonine-protein kinase
MFVPTTFGKYYLTEHLATGGMAEIYRGKLLGPGGFEKQLVIKQIHPRFGQRREFVDLFVAEAKTSVSLSHGNIVPIYELGVVDGTYFIAMEYVDGPTLAELGRAARGRRRRLGPAMAATITQEILKGLDYAHRRGGVIHRDLSPRNVMVSRDGEVKILDFGLAATFENAAEASKITSGGGRPVGSFPYMSPEQARRQPLDARSDLFSCGILLWEMLTGESLFARADEDATLAAVCDAPIPAPSTLAPEVPPVLDAACLRALERDTAKRWSSAGELSAALSRYLFGVEPHVTPATIGALVRELCPELPRAVPGERPASVGSVAPTAAGDPRTTPMSDGDGRTADGGRGTGEHKSFATHVELERALERNRTPLMPFPALEQAAAKVLSSVPEVAPSTPSPSPSASPSPLRRGDGSPTGRLARVGAARGRRSRVVVAAALVAALALGAVAAAYLWKPPAVGGAVADGGGAGVGGAADAGDVIAVPLDGGTAGLAPPGADDAGAGTSGAPHGADTDAGVVTPIKRPARDAGPATASGRGRLIVFAPDVAWASVWVDGKRVGETPIPAPGVVVPAGKHRLVVRCEPAVCPPDGKERALEVTVPSDGAVEREVRF